MFSASGNKVTDSSCQNPLLLGARSTGSGAIQEWSGVLLTYKRAFFVEHSLRMTLELLGLLRLSEQLFGSNSCAQGRVTSEQRHAKVSMRGDQGPLSSCSSYCLQKQWQGFSSGPQGRSFGRDYKESMGYENFHSLGESPTIKTKL